MNEEEKEEDWEIRQTEVVDVAFMSYQEFLRMRLLLLHGGGEF